MIRVAIIPENIDVFHPANRRQLGGMIGIVKHARGRTSRVVELPGFQRPNQSGHSG
jgi:hypothetical protein